MQNAMTNETCRYSLSFGDKSIYDKASENLFKAFGKKSQEKESNQVQQSYLQMFLDYQKSIHALDKPLVWHIAESPNQQNDR